MAEDITFSPEAEAILSQKIILRPNFLKHRPPNKKASWSCDFTKNRNKQDLHLIQDSNNSKILFGGLDLIDPKVVPFMIDTFILKNKWRLIRVLNDFSSDSPRQRELIAIITKRSLTPVVKIFDSKRKSLQSFWPNRVEIVLHQIPPSYGIGEIETFIFRIFLIALTIVDIAFSKECIHPPISFFLLIYEDFFLERHKNHGKCKFELSNMVFCWI